MSAFDQPLVETTSSTQPALDSQHSPLVSLVIVAQKVQQAVQGENPELGAFRVARCAGLASGDTSRDDDVPQKGLRAEG